MTTLYLICNAMLLIVYPLAMMWRLPVRTGLWLGRVLLCCCIAGPVAFHYFPPIRSAPIDTLGKVFDEATEEIFPIISPGNPDKPPHSDRSILRLIQPYEIFWSLVLAGVGLGLIRLVRDLSRIRRIVQATVVFRRRGCVDVLISSDITTPFSFRGIQRRYVVLPVTMLNNNRDVQIAISHEAQHHRQGDCLIAYFQELLRAVFLWNPMVHLWLKKLNELQEFSCDEALVGRRRLSPHEYGSCLVRVARTASHTGMACAIGMAAPPILHRRIVMLFDYQASAPRKLGLSLFVLFVSLSTSIGLAYTLSGNLPLDRLDRTHVDNRLQLIADEEIQAALARHGATSGAVAVVEPQTGNIVAFAEAGTGSWETRAIAPGSVIKPLIVSAAMDAGLVTSETLLDCRGPLVIDGESFHDDRSHDRLTTKEVLAQSSNIGAIRVGQLLGLNNIKSSLAGFGIPYETIIAGDSADLRVARLSFGQTVSTTISSLARAYGNLAINGNTEIKNMLVYAVTNGTGRRAAVPGYSVAGKTGTMLIKGERAQTDSSASRYRDTILASFVGFVPANAPRYIIYAILENPRAPSSHGGAAAAPLFQRVASRSLNARVDQNSSEL